MIKDNYIFKFMHFDFNKFYSITIEKPTEILLILLIFKVEKIFNNFLYKEINIIK